MAANSVGCHDASLLAHFLGNLGHFRSMKQTEQLTDAADEAIVQEREILWQQLAYAWGMLRQADR